MKLAPVFGLASVVLFLLGAAATQRVPKDDAPEVKLRAERLSENGLRCVSARDVEVKRGPVPRGAREVVRIMLSGAEAHPLELFEEAMAERATRYCCDGISVLQATAGAAAGGVTSATAVGWTRVPVDEPEPAPAPTDAGSDPFEF